MCALAKLKKLIDAANGPSGQLDRAVSDALGVPLRDYSSSVDACLGLIHDLLPGAHWHVGRADDGVSLYASLSRGRRRAENTNTTVPLALLTVIAALTEKPD